MPSLSRVRPVGTRDVPNETRFVPLVQEVLLDIAEDSDDDNGRSLPLKRGAILIDTSVALAIKPVILNQSN